MSMGQSSLEIQLNVRMTDSVTLVRTGSLGLVYHGGDSCTAHIPHNLHEQQYHYHLPPPVLLLLLVP